MKLITLDTTQLNGMTLHRLMKIKQAPAQINVYTVFIIIINSAFLLSNVCSKVCFQTACLDLTSVTLNMFDILILSRFTGIVFQAS